MKVKTPDGFVVGTDGLIVKTEFVNLPQVMELVYIGEYGFYGEVVTIKGKTGLIQVYEDITGLKPGEPVYRSGAPLSIELGPGLLGGIFDGTARPLTSNSVKDSVFIKRGKPAPTLDPEKKWEFTPLLKKNSLLSGGEIIGTIRETSLIEHRVIIPPDIEGVLVNIAETGEYTVSDKIGEVRTPYGETIGITIKQTHPIKTPRPVKERIPPSQPLITGQRVIDTFFPIAKGGACAIPGGFGAGKTITQHQLARWSKADIVIYVGCGERGNEITEILETFPSLKDPKTGKPLSERTVIIANTSNMPVTAREASIYTGITIAEYYRDMGYDVALLTDSLSRWAEALREISGRLEEMPAEEGYPAYLSSRIAEFYERAGAVVALSDKSGSVSIIASVSPPGADFSEPVTQSVKRFVRCFWELDKSLASARHFPSINWMRSYSEYGDICTQYWEKMGYYDYAEIRAKAFDILQREDRLLKIARLIGADSLPDNERLVLETSRLIRTGFLKQNAYDETDAYSSPEKQILILRLILKFYERALSIISIGAPIFEIQGLESIAKIARLKMTVSDDNLSLIDETEEFMMKEFDGIESVYKE
jgi:V/A-type H+-transporting ATPase subunit A